MSMIKSTALLLATVVALGGLSACSKSNTSTGASNKNGQPMNQTFGKSYVKEVPQTTVKKKEAEMTSPNVPDKGPAIGGEPNKKNDQKKNDQNKTSSKNQKKGTNPVANTWNKVTGKNTTKTGTSKTSTTHKG